MEQWLGFDAADSRALASTVGPPAQASMRRAALRLLRRHRPASTQYDYADPFQIEGVMLSLPTSPMRLMASCPLSLMLCLPAERLTQTETHAISLISPFDQRGAGCNADDPQAYPSPLSLAVLLPVLHSPGTVPVFGPDPLEWPCEHLSLGAISGSSNVAELAAIT